MNPSQGSTIPAEEKFCETACGATIRITPDTPFIHYRDEVVYFCGQGCKHIFDHDPLSSCLAARLLSGK